MVISGKVEEKKPRGRKPEALVGSNVHRTRYENPQCSTCRNQRATYRDSLLKKVVCAKTVPVSAVVSAVPVT